MIDGYHLRDITASPYAGRLRLRLGYGTSPHTWPHDVSIFLEQGALIVGHGDGSILWDTLRHGQGIVIPAGSTRIMAALEPVVAYVISAERPPLPIGRSTDDVLSHADTRPFSAGAFEGDYAAHEGSYEDLRDETGKKLHRLLERCEGCQTFLEAGCSRGYLVHDLIKAGRQAVGLDVSAWAIEQAFGEARGHTTVYQLGADELPWKDNAFDCVHSWDTLEHVPVWNLQRALDDVCRLAAKWLVIRTPLRTYLNRYQPHDWSMSDPNAPGADITHVSCMPEDFWVAEVERRGLLNVSVEIWNAQIHKAEGWMWFRRGD